MYYQLNEFFCVTRSDDAFQVLQEGKCSMSHPIHHKFLREKFICQHSLFTKFYQQTISKHVCVMYDHPYTSARTKAIENNTLV